MMDMPCIYRLDNLVLVLIVIIDNLSLQAVQVLLIGDLQQLTDLRGLENLASFTELSILNNWRLTTLQHFGANVSEDHRINVTSIGIRDNPELQDIAGFRFVQHVTGTELFRMEVLG